jgi:hypothetical protein
MRTLGQGIQRNVRLALIALSAVAALLMFSAAADAQAPDGFGIVRGPTLLQDGWIAQVFADPSRTVTNAYSNTLDPDSWDDPYPVPGEGVPGVYELAGGHPFIGVTDFSMIRVPDGPPVGGNVDHLRVDVPPGLVPNPNAFDRCTDEELKKSTCPVSSQIGTEELRIWVEDLESLTGDVVLRVPLYNMTPLSNPADAPQQDVPARFGFNPAEAGEAIVAVPALGELVGSVVGLEPVHIVGGVRDAPSVFGPHDYGLFFTIDHLPHYDPDDGKSPGVLRSDLTFWGAPGDAAHNDQRGKSCLITEKPILALGSTFCSLVGAPGTTPPAGRAFLTNPTHCPEVPQITGIAVFSQNGSPDSLPEPTPTITSVDDGQPHDAAQRCENVPFDAEIAVAPDVTTPDTPTGPKVDVTVPDDAELGWTDRGKFANSHIRDVQVTLPPGMTINPSVANGLEACTDDQLAADIGVPGGEACPEGSEVGTVEAVSPLLPPTAAAPSTDPVLTGTAYVGQPIPGDKYRLFVTVEGRGISIRLKGSVKLDPATGQVTATFQNNPQQPVDRLTVDFEDGPRAPLATPLDCGPKAATGTLVPWSGNGPLNVTAAPFEVAGEGCPPGFNPSFGAASANPSAGAKAPFTATLTRPDQNRLLSRARVVTPPGLAGMISKVTECSDAGAATGACPASSRIGTVTTAAGAGPEPYSLSGSVYLTDGYKGAPFGMVAVVRAIAGPYDLGTVIVREALFVDPEDAHVTVVSDPFPTILDGVPIRLRDVRFALDTPGFAYNPTSCGPKEVRATLYPTEGTAIDRSTTLTIGNCEALGFTPKMSMQLIGPRQTRFEGHPSLKTVVTSPEGQANIGRVRVVLPRALALDPKNSQKVCSVADAAKADCPATTRIGVAKAVSPALDRPLSGPAYFVQGVRTDPSTGAQIRTLPSLLVKLRGQIAINLRGTTAVENRNLVSTFDRIPDAPVSEFALTLKGGKKGPLVVSARRGICDREQITNAQMAGQNGKAKDQKVDMIKPCRRPLIVFRTIKASASRLVVRGTIRKKADKPLKVTLRCGSKGVTKRASRRGTRWAVGIKRTGACADARKAKLRVTYPGGGDFRIAVRKRSVRLPAGS